MSWVTSSAETDPTYSEHMEGARFTIPTAALLSKVVDLLDHIPMDQRDTDGDLYEYLLSKLSTCCSAHPKRTGTFGGSWSRTRNLMRW